LHNNEIINVEKGDTTKNSYGIAFDIGTTTVAGYLVDLNTGEELSAVAKANPQIIYGDDVISELDLPKQKENLGILQRKIVNILNEIIKESAKKAGGEALVIDPNLEAVKEAMN